MQIEKMFQSAFYLSFVFTLIPIAQITVDIKMTLAHFKCTIGIICRSVAIIFCFHIVLHADCQP